MSTRDHLAVEKIKAACAAAPGNLEKVRNVSRQVKGRHWRRLEDIWRRAFQESAHRIRRSPYQSKVKVGLLYNFIAESTSNCLDSEVFQWWWSSGDADDERASDVSSARSAAEADRLPVRKAVAKSALLNALSTVNMNLEAAHSTKSKVLLEACSDILCCE